VSFALYLLGFLVLIGGIGWGLATAGLAQHWILIICVILAGVGILTGVTRTRGKDPAWRSGSPALRSDAAPRGQRRRARL